MRPALPPASWCSMARKRRNPVDAPSPSPRRALLGLLALAGVAASSPTVQAEPRAHVTLNGKPVPVFFNDGDSFRVLSGTYNGAKARLSGYNTLESYGPVHQWGSWTAKELYNIAKMATLFARRGTWTCETDGKTDTYGRMLVWCPDLADALVRGGYAHVMSIDDNPGKAELLEAQKEAIENRRGIWAHGVPDFILTSLHSVEEDTDGSGTYNRLVSTDDAHSVKWKHTNKYAECDNVCHQLFTVDDDAVDAVTTALASDAAVEDIVGELDQDALRSVVHDFAEFRHINREVKKDDRERLHEHLMTNYVAQGRFGTQTKQKGSCMIHVHFQRRFGGGRAQCLK